MKNGRGKAAGLWRAPALHMVLIGAAAFAGSALFGGSFFEPRPRIVVPQHRFDEVLKAFVSDHLRPPTKEEHDALLDDLIDEEVLYNYALILGLHEQDAARRRLALIADFVEANPHETASESERAAAAMEMGLHRGDLVVRRILVDCARRLIRGVVLLHEPDPELVEDYLEANQEQYLGPARARLSHVIVNAFKWPDTAARAKELKVRIESESLSVEEAIALEEEVFVPARLPALSEQALANRFGIAFAAEAMRAPAGAWSGPMASRYGHHLVYVHERLAARSPALEEIRDRVLSDLLHEKADAWLEFRLRELRAAFEIVAPPRAS